MTDATHSPTTTLVIDTSAVMPALEYLDSIDIADISLNPGYHGYTDDQAHAISTALISLRNALGKVAVRL